MIKLNLQILINHFRKKLVQGVEFLHLNLLLKLIKTSSFNGKMNALNELNRIITPFLFNRLVIN